MVLNTCRTTNRGNRLTQCHQQVVPGPPNRANSPATAPRDRRSHSKCAVRHVRNELAPGGASKKKPPHSSSCRTNARFVPRYSGPNMIGSGTKSRSIYPLRNGYAHSMALEPRTSLLASDAASTVVRLHQTTLISKRTTIRPAKSGLLRNAPFTEKTIWSSTSAWYTVLNMQSGQWPAGCCLYPMFALDVGFVALL